MYLAKGEWVGDVSNEENLTFGAFGDLRSQLKGIGVGRCRHMQKWVCWKIKPAAYLY